MPFSAGGERILLIGYGRRTNRMTIDFLRTAILPKFADRIIGVELAEWRINLDGGMVVLSDDTVVIHRPSLLSAVSVTKDEVVE